MNEYSDTTDICEHYVGLDVSLKSVSICVCNQTGDVLWRGEVANEPAVVVKALAKHAPRLVRAVLETGSCGIHLYRGLEAGNIPVICICARHAKGVLGVLQFEQRFRHVNTNGDA